MVAGHEMVRVGRDALRASVFGRVGGHIRCVPTFTIIPMVFYQSIGQFCHQLPFHLANDRGGDQTRFRELQFQMDRVEHRVAPLQGLFADVFCGFVGVVGRDFVN